MKNRVWCNPFGHFAQFCDVVYSAGFVAYVHNRHERYVWREKFFKLGFVYAPVTVYGCKYYVETLSRKLICAVYDRVVLAKADYNPTALLFSRAKERGVVRFAPARKKIQLALACVQCALDLFASVFYANAQSNRRLIKCRRIEKIVFAFFADKVGDFRINPSRRGVVKINEFLHFLMF